MVEIKRFSHDTKSVELFAEGSLQPRGLSLKIRGLFPNQMAKGCFGVPFKDHQGSVGLLLKMNGGAKTPKPLRGNGFLWGSLVKTVGGTPNMATGSFLEIPFESQNRT